MARLVGLLAAVLVLLFLTAALVGFLRERAVYQQLAERNVRPDLMEHRSAVSSRQR